MRNAISMLTICLVLLSNVSCKKEALPNITSIEELEKALKEEMDYEDLTSISYCVVKNDKILYSNAMGYADYENKIPATDSTRYLIASISKTITAVALMQLVDQDVISLDDDINQYLPFSVRNPRYPDEAITFRMLLSHTSSISDDNIFSFDLDCYGVDCPMSLDKFFKDVFLSTGEYYSSNNFINKRPGTKEEYSNLGLALVGYLVERIAQMPFDVYCENNIFIPLGMNKTEWRLSKTPLSELAIPYSNDIENTNNPHYTFPDYPNGGLRTNVIDLSKFLSAFMLNGSLNGTRILSAAGATEMKTLQFGSSEQCLSFYFDDIDGRTVLGHSGGEKGVTTEMFYDPKTNVGAIIFNNDDDADLVNMLSLLFSYGANQ
ncbi:MAG: beta-lactamase family protein [Chitinophagales bacterium]|nr:beta-lactamase family protein [Chitinophagales bacterium]